MARTFALLVCLTVIFPAVRVLADTPQTGVGWAHVPPDDSASGHPFERLANLGMEARYGTRNPFGFMDLQDVQEVSNFFERRVSAYQVGVTGEVGFDEDF